MNFRVLLKSMKFAFRAKKRVFTFMVIYAILLLIVGNELEAAGSNFAAAIPWLGVAFIVSTLYALLIAQFRRRDIAILKCVSWGNSEIMLLLVGEVILVAFAAFLLIFQLSVEILGIATYFYIQNTPMIIQLQSMIALEPNALFTSMFWVVIMQVFGLLIAQARAGMIPPMRALREE